MSNSSASMAESLITTEALGYVPVNVRIDELHYPSIKLLLPNNLRIDNIIGKICRVDMRRNNKFWWKETIFINLRTICTGH